MNALLLRPGACQRWVQIFLAGCLALVVAGAACSRGGTPEAADCPTGAFSAVEIVLEDESGEGVNGASLRYRVDDEPWRGLPEKPDQKTIIRGRPGLYQIEVSKQGHMRVETTVAVLAESDEACRPAPERVTLQLARVPCPTQPESLLLTLDRPTAELEVDVALPESGQQTPVCQQREGGSCSVYALPVGELGVYEVTLKGLPGLGPMLVVSNVVTYETPPVTLELEHRGQGDSVELTGAQAAGLTFQVRRDEANCALADFRALDARLTPDPAAVGPQPPLAVSYQGSLTITDPGAVACQREPLQTALPFVVDLPAGTNVDEVQVVVDYGEGWQPATCEFAAGRYVCRALVPNPLLYRPFAVRARADGQEAIGMQLPFSGMCLIFE